MNGLSCPWCSMPANPSPAPQSCGGCRSKFTLSAGPGLDGSIMPPPPNPGVFVIKVKWTTVVTYKFATLDAGGVVSGTLDPVVALAPLDQVGIAFPDVVSIAVWRKLSWTDVIVGVLVPVPISLFCLFGAALSVTRSPSTAGIFAVIGVIFGLVAFYLLRRGIFIGSRQARIVGRYGTCTVEFKTSPAFHAELFRRCGLIAPPIP